MKTKLLASEDLTHLSTKRLLAYRNSLYRVPEGPSHTDDLPPYQTDDGTWHYMHKRHPVWQEALSDVKAELAKREHVERGGRLRND